MSEEPRGRARGGARRGGPPGSARGGGRGRGRGGRGGIQTKTLNEMFSNIQKNHARQFGLGQTKTLTEDDIEARSAQTNPAEQEEVKTEQQAPQRKRYGANRADA